MEVLKILNNFSGLLAVFSFILIGIIFFASQRNFLASWRKDYDACTMAHTEKMDDILKKTDGIMTEIKTQEIHDAYLRQTVEKSNEINLKVHEAINRLIATLERLEIKKNQC